MNSIDGPDTDSYLASSVQFESQTDTIAAAIRLAKAKNRSKKDVGICWDEWNVWYRAVGGDGEWSEAPHILEEVYNLEDALVVAPVAQHLPAQGRRDQDRLHRPDRQRHRADHDQARRHVQADHLLPAGAVQ